MKHLLVTASLAFLSLSACAASPETVSGPLPQLTFQNLQPLSIPVEKISLTNSYDPALTPNNKATSFPTPPDVALRRYFENRYDAKGKESDGTLEIVIEDASIKHRIIKSDNPVGALFGVGEAEEYDLDVVLTIRHISVAGNELAKSVVTYDKLKSYPTNMSLAELESELTVFIQEAIAGIDVPIQENMAQLIRKSKINREASSLLSSPLKNAIEKDEGLPGQAAPSQMKPIIE